MSVKNEAWKIILVIVLTLLSGLGDSRGFIHAARMWENGKLIWRETLVSGLGYGFGILMYWFAIRYLTDLGVISPTIQTLGWFGVTIIGIALFSGDFFAWQMLDRVIAVFVILGLGWLLFRTGG